MPRHPRGEALLDDERPATRGADGSQACLGGSLRSGERWCTRARARRLGAREVKLTSVGEQPSTSARRTGLHSHRHAGDESASERTHRAHGCITLGPDGGRGRIAANPRPHAVARRGDRAWRPRRTGAGKRRGAARATERACTAPVPTGQVRDSIRSGSDHGKRRRLRHGCGRRHEREGDAISNRSAQTPRHTTPIQQRGVLRGVGGAFVLSGTSGYVCRLGPRQLRGGRRTTASHQSRPRTVAPRADRSGQNPRRHLRSRHTQAEGRGCPDSVSEPSDVAGSTSG